jgi:rod shape-determining protein MreC
VRIFIVSVFVLILGLLDFLNPLRAAFQKFTTPVQYGLRSGAMGLKDSYQLFSNVNNIRQENLSLMKENQELKGEIVDLKKADEENKLLRYQLELKNKDYFDEELLLALVMGNPEDTTGTSLMIDKGTRQGVEVGDNVVVGNFLVGIVSRVSEERSVVDLIISPEVSMTVINVEGANKAEGIASGNLGTSVQVEKLLPNDRVEVGDIFLTSGRDGRFIPGLVVGEVADVIFESADPLKSADLEPMILFSRLDKVFVILSS